MSTRHLAQTGLVAAGAMLCFGTTDAVAQDRPNIVLMMVDNYG